MNRTHVMHLGGTSPAWCTRARLVFSKGRGPGEQGRCHRVAWLDCGRVGCGLAVVRHERLLLATYVPVPCPALPGRML